MKSTSEAPAPSNTRTPERHKKRRSPKLAIAAAGLALLGATYAKTDLMGTSITPRPTSDLSKEAVRDYQAATKGVTARDLVATEFGSADPLSSQQFYVNVMQSGTGLKGWLSGVTYNLSGNRHREYFTQECLNGSPYDVGGEMSDTKPLAAVVVDGADPDQLEIVSTNPGLKPLNLRGLQSRWLVPADSYTINQLTAYGCTLSSTVSLSYTWNTDPGPGGGANF